MTYSVLIQKNPSGGYIARAMSWPEFVAQAATRAEAIIQIRETIAHLLAKGEIVEVEIPQPTGIITAAYAETFGAFKGDPTFTKFVKATRSYHLKRNKKPRSKARA